MEFRYAWGDGEATVQVQAAGDGLWVTIRRPGQEPVGYRVMVLRCEAERLILRMGERHLLFHVARDGKARVVAQGARVFRLEPPTLREARPPAAGDLTAVMPGKVLDVLVQPGQRVDAGTPLVILEAMKMELRITAPGDGVVAAVLVRAGDVVNPGQKLVELH